MRFFSVAPLTALRPGIHRTGTPSVDVNRIFEPLHNWFENALETDPARRFPDAVSP